MFLGPKFCPAFCSTSFIRNVTDGVTDRWLSSEAFGGGPGVGTRSKLLIKAELPFQMVRSFLKLF